MPNLVQILIRENGKEIELIILMTGRIRARLEIGDLEQLTRAEHDEKALERRHAQAAQGTRGARTWRKSSAKKPEENANEIVEADED